MSTVYLFLVEGFEEIEALTAVDILSRGDVEAKTVGVAGGVVEGRSGIQVLADVDASDGFTLPADAAMVVLPGGPGTFRLKESAMVEAAVREADKRELPIAAICAAPTVLAGYGMLKGKRATCFPGMENEMDGADCTGRAVETDGRFTTGRSAGVALQFAHRLLEILRDKDTADKVVHNVYPGN